MIHSPASRLRTHPCVLFIIECYICAFRIHWIRWHFSMRRDFEGGVYWNQPPYRCGEISRAAGFRGAARFRGNTVFFWCGFQWFWPTRCKLAPYEAILHIRIHCACYYYMYMYMYVGCWYWDDLSPILIKPLYYLTRLLSCRQLWSIMQLKWPSAAEMVLTTAHGMCSGFMEWQLSPYKSTLVVHVSSHGLPFYEILLHLHSWKI